jgi:hypothetical protein
MGLLRSEEEIVRRREAKDERLRELVRTEVAAALARQPQLPPPPTAPAPDHAPRLAPDQLEELLPPFSSIRAKNRPPYSLRPPAPYLRAIELLARESGRSQNDLGCTALREFLDRELADYEERNGHLPTDWIRDGDPDPDPPPDE